LNFWTAGVSTSPGWSSNVIGELSHGLLKSAKSPADASETASTLRDNNLTANRRSRLGIMGLDLGHSKQSSPATRRAMMLFA